MGLYFDYNDTPDEYRYHELGEWDIINHQGKQVKLSDRYQGVIGDFADYDGFQEGYLGVFDDAGKYGFVDKDGKVVIPLEYDEIRSFSETLAGVMKDGKWGFIDKNNQTIIAFDHPDDTSPRYSVNFMGVGMFIFDDGVAEVGTNTQDKTACIDKNANSVPCPHDFDH